MDKTKLVHSLHGKFIELMRLAEQLEKTPRKFGTDEEISSTEIHLIELIGDNKSKNMSVTDLAALHGVTKGAISQNLKRLEKKGLTAKEEDPANTSRSILTLTSKGYIAYYAHKHWHESMDGGFIEYFENLEPDKVAFIHEFLDVVITFFSNRIATEK